MNEPKWGSGGDLLTTPESNDAYLDALVAELQSEEGVETGGPSPEMPSSREDEVARATGRVHEMAAGQQLGPEATTTRNNEQLNDIDIIGDIGLALLQARLRELQEAPELRNDDFALVA